MTTLRPRPTHPLVASALLSFVVGCAETTPSAPAMVFPTRAEIARIPSRPALPQAFGTGDVAVDTWSVESATAAQDGAYDDPSAWGDLLRDLTKGRGTSVALSPAMRCAATEIGRFHLKNRALPDDRLRRFILARCGGETPNLDPIVWYADAPKGVSDALLLDKAREALAGAVDTELAHGHHVVGLAEVRDEKRAAVVVAIGQDEAQLEPGTRRIDAARAVTLRGTARGGYETIGGLVNRGEYGVSRCASDPRVRAPRFALTCTVAPGDPFDWVEIVGQPRGRLMLRPLADVLVYDGDPSAARFQTKAHGPPAPVATAAEFTDKLVDRLNGVRATAGMPRVTLAPKQSAENERLAGTLLDATVQGDDASVETAMLGLLAGWEIDGGTIRGGQFFLGTAAPTRDATTWLDAAIERPIGRVALLDPEARQIAVGPSLPEGGAGLGAAVTTYALFESSDHTSDEAAFFARIKEARAARGLSTPVRLPTSDETRRIAAGVLKEEETPKDALDTMLSAASARSGMATYGYVLETTDPATVEIPDVFLNGAPLALTLAITHHRAKGAAWGQYVILAVLGGGVPARTVEAAARSPRKVAWLAR